MAKKILSAIIAASAPVASSTVLVKEGWLGKQGDGGLFSSSTDFKRRWCRCSETRLEILVEHGGRRVATSGAR